MNRFCWGSEEFFNEAFRSPNLKTCFSFALRCPQDFHQAQQFWCGQVETGPNGQKWMGKLKFCMHPRAKLKHVLWLGDLKASLINCTAITHHLISNDHMWHMTFCNFTKNPLKHKWPHQLCKKFVKETIFNIWRNEKYFSVLLIYQLFGYNLGKIQ